MCIYTQIQVRSIVSTLLCVSVKAEQSLATPKGDDISEKGWGLTSPVPQYKVGWPKPVLAARVKWESRTSRKFVVMRSEAKKEGQGQIQQLLGRSEVKLGRQPRTKIWRVHSQVLQHNSGRAEDPGLSWNGASRPMGRGGGWRPRWGCSGLWMCSRPSQFHMIYCIDVILRLGLGLPFIICACLQVYMFRCLCIMSHDFYELFIYFFFVCVLFFLIPLVLRKSVSNSCGKRRYFGCLLWCFSRSFSNFSVYIKRIVKLFWPL